MGIVIVCRHTRFSRLSYGMFCLGYRGPSGELWTVGHTRHTQLFGYLVGTLCLSPLISRFPDQRHVINRITCLFLGLTLIGSAFSDHFTGLGLWRFIIGLLSAFATVLVLSIAMDSVRPEERGVASGLIWLGGSAGILVTGFSPLYHRSFTLAGLAVCMDDYGRIRGHCRVRFRVRQQKREWKKFLTV